MKTEIAFAPNEHETMVGPRKYRYHSPVVSDEWCGFTNFPWGRGLINFAEEEEARAMGTYATWACSSSCWSLLLDRRPLSHLDAGLAEEAPEPRLRIRLARGAARGDRLPAPVT